MRKARRPHVHAVALLGRCVPPAVPYAEDALKRWNGWGDDAVSMPLPKNAGAFLHPRVGPATAPEDARLSDVVGSVPPSRLPSSPLFSTEALDRVKHARGQSFPDWLALRSGRIGLFPDGVAFPEKDADVRALLSFAKETGARLVPFGGGTSVVGHVNPLPSDQPVLTVDLTRMSRLLALDLESRLATFGAGVLGPDLEAQLRPHGFTLGHFPQSFEHSTLGGWIATRSSGQQSLGYGRIERLFAGGRLESPEGPLVLPPFPASAAGPDLREVVLGSEGRIGILTEATVRVSPIPRGETFHAVFFPNWDAGFVAVRAIAQTKLALSMLRLSTPIETETSFALSAGILVTGMEKYLALRGARAGKCLLFVGAAGGSRAVEAARKDALSIAREAGGIVMGQPLGKHWLKNRFKAPYLRNALWEAGYGVDTLETAAPWSKIHLILAGVEQGLREALHPIGEKVHVYSHLSHAYPDGSSAYTTYVFRLAQDPDETLDRWKRLKGAASCAIVAGGGTISHQHGVGVDHALYLPAEKGELGLSALRAIARFFDPGGLMNPGKLFS